MLHQHQDHNNKEHNNKDHNNHKDKSKAADQNGEALSLTIAKTAEVDPPAMLSIKLAESSRSTVEKDISPPPFRMDLVPSLLVSSNSETSSKFD